MMMVGSGFRQESPNNPRRRKDAHENSGKGDSGRGSAAGKPSATCCPLGIPVKALRG